MKRFLISFLFATIAVAATANASTETEAETTKKTAEQVLAISNAVKEYKKKHDRLPGDKNHDGMIGKADITEQLTVPSSVSSSDETTLFWQELRDVGYLKDFQFIKKDGIEYPRTAIEDVYFKVGFFNGSQDTIKFTNRPVRGNALIFARDKSTHEEGMAFPMTAKAASDIDKDLDDGNPAYRLVRAYGECVSWIAKTEVRRLNPQHPKSPQYKYSNDDSKINCGLIVIISD